MRKAPVLAACAAAALLLGSCGASGGQTASSGTGGTATASPSTEKLDALPPLPEPNDATTTAPGGEVRPTSAAATDLQLRMAAAAGNDFLTAMADGDMAAMMDRSTPEAYETFVASVLRGDVAKATTCKAAQVDGAIQCTIEITMADTPEGVPGGPFTLTLGEQGGIWLVTDAAYAGPGNWGD